MLKYGLKKSLSKATREGIKSMIVGGVLKKIKSMIKDKAEMKSDILKKADKLPGKLGESVTKLSDSVKGFDDMVDEKFDKDIKVRDIIGYEIVSKIDSKVEKFPSWALDKDKRNFLSRVN